MNYRNGLEVVEIASDLLCQAFRSVGKEREVGVGLGGLGRLAGARRCDRLDLLAA